MGASILAVIGIFVALHIIFPAVTLWPAAVIALAAVTMFVSHSSSSRRTARSLVHPESFGNRN